MSVHCNLSTLMGMKRYSIQDVHSQTGLSRNTISNLYNDKASRIDYETIEKLCNLFECTPNELFEVKTIDRGNNH
ncbi:MAG: helix-turn-helix transcriptional regulator [Eubacterium sp.]|nr:helix-turn-helix transcriptional regulator [Eubacterium sp.]